MRDRLLEPKLSFPESDSDRSPRSKCPFMIAYNILIEQKHRLAKFHGDGQPIDPVLSETIRVSCLKNDIPQTLTYEELILIDPALPTIGSDDLERYFYEVHRDIEFSGRIIVDFLFRFFNNPESINISDIDLFQNNIDGFEQALKKVNTFTEPSFVAGFKEFRGYFHKHPVSDEPGASGLYSALFRTLNQLLEQENYPNLDDSKYLPRFDNGDYTTVEQIQTAQELRLQSGSAFDVLDKLKESKVKEVLNQQLIQLLEVIKNFRQDHFKAIRANIPQVLSGDPGTGGISEVAKFLGIMLRLTTQTLKNRRKLYASTK